MSNDTRNRVLISRRGVLAGASASAAGALLSACSTNPPPATPAAPAAPRIAVELLPYQQMYGKLYDEGFELPAVPVERLDRKFLRQVVADPTGEPPGTVVVDVSSHFLYLVREGGEALRYGVGLGKQGFEWSGRAIIEWKQKWPRWFPPDEMIDRRPELEEYRASYDPATRTWLGGMEPGLQNPLGARAHYIYQNGKDTLYRVHGSPEWWSIGQSVSSGCVRMINQDVVDLYDRVPEKTPILVTSGLRVA